MSAAQQANTEIVMQVYTFRLVGRIGGGRRTEKPPLGRDFPLVRSRASKSYLERSSVELWWHLFRIGILWCIRVYPADTLSAARLIYYPIEYTR